MPDISVVIATYNGEKYLEETLESVLAQTDVEYEIIVVDDGSKDNTRLIIERYAARFGQITTKFHDRNQGIIPTYAHGVRLSSSPLFKVLDQDDTLVHESVLRDQTRLINSCPEIGWVTGAVNLTNDTGEVYRVMSYQKTGLIDNDKVKSAVLWQPKTPFKHGAGVYRREAHEEYGTFDNLFILQLASSNWHLAYDSSPVLNYRCHQSNATRSARVRATAYVERVAKASSFIEDPVQRAVYIMYSACVEIMKVAYSTVTPIK